MGRQVRRVPVDFDWPPNEVWQGFLLPECLHTNKCPDCENGYSPAAQSLLDLWYGNAPFNPTSTDSKPWRHDTPAIRTRVEHNLTQAPDFYGTGEAAIVREAQRLADLFNSQWAHNRPCTPRRTGKLSRIGLMVMK